MAGATFKFWHDLAHERADAQASMLATAGLVARQLDEVISVSDGIWPKLRSSGAVTSEAITSGLAPGSWVVT